MNATTQITLTHEEVEANNRFHYEAETRALNDLFFSKFRVAKDDDGEVIFIKENGAEMFDVKYEKSYLTPAEDTFTLDTIKEELIPEYVFTEKKPSNKEAEMIKEWWGLYTEEKDGRTYWYSKEEHYIPVGGYNRDWLKEDGKTPWSMLQIRRQVCREGNLKHQANLIDIREVLKCYKLNEKYWNSAYGGRMEMGGWEGNVIGAIRVFQSRMMRKISDRMDETLKDLKDECRRKGISGFSGKKKWALVNHIIEYDTGLDIFDGGGEIYDYGDYDYVYKFRKYDDLYPNWYKYNVLVYKCEY